MQVNRYWPELTMAISFVLANRLQFILQMAGDLMQVLVLYFIWTAAFANSPQIGGMSLETMVTYIFVAQTFRIITAYNMEGQLAAYIQTGDIIRDLIVPQTYTWKRLWFTIGWLLTIGGLTAVPLMLAGLLFFGVALPPTHLLPALLVSLLFALVISYGLSSITGSLAFWTGGSLWGVSTAKRVLIAFTSGAFIPLALLPGWMQSFTRWLPFQAGVHIPTSIYLGQLQGNAVAEALAVQALWAVGLLWAADRFFAYSLRQMTIPGG